MSIVGLLGLWKESILDSYHRFLFTYTSSTGKVMTEHEVIFTLQYSSSSDSVVQVRQYSKLWTLSFEQDREENICSQQRHEAARSNACRSPSDPEPLPSAVRTLYLVAERGREDQMMTCQKQESKKS